VKWPVGGLSELCEINVGRTPARNNAALWGNGAPWLSIADMNQGPRIRRTKEEISPEGARSSKIVVPGTVLLSFKLTIGKVAVADIPLYTNEAIAALPIKDPKRLHRDYLVHALRSMNLASGANSAAMGATLNKAKLQQLQIPLPPLDEQRRIAAILDHADGLRAKRRGVLQYQRDLPQAVFRDTFGGWNGPCATIADVALPEKGSIRTGPFGSQLLHGEFVDQGIAVLGLDNVVGNEFTWGERRYITAEKYNALRRYTVRPADVLMSIMGTCGRCVVVPSDIETAINTKHICAITVDPQKALPDFVRAAFLWHPMSRQFLARMTKGSVMDGLNMGIIKTTPIPLPDLAVQQAFVERAKLIDKCTRVSADLQTKSDELFASIQARVFRGEL
jgi:type I restriction enzyme S subunit